MIAFTQVETVYEPSKVQPEFVNLARAAHRVPVGKSPHMYFTLDRITFECPLHPFAKGFDDLDEVIEYAGYSRVRNYGSKMPLEIAGRGPNAGINLSGHSITIYAQAGKSEVYRTRKSKIEFYIYGYTINGTQITITPQIIGACDEDARYSEELYQETGEKYARNCGYKEVYASPVNGLTTTVRVVK